MAEREAWCPLRWCIDTSESLRFSIALDERASPGEEKAELGLLHPSLSRLAGFRGLGGGRLAR